MTVGHLGQEMKTLNRACPILFPKVFIPIKQKSHLMPLVYSVDLDVQETQV